MSVNISYKQLLHEDFITDLKSRFLGDQKDEELPQHNSLFRAFDPELFLKHASKVLDFNLESALNAKRVFAAQKGKRDLLVYLLWKSGGLSNKEIGKLLGVTYSSVSKIVHALNERMLTEKGLKGKMEKLFLQIKVTPLLQR